MNFIATSGELQKALNTVNGIISNSQSRPILDNFLIELENEYLTITASDGETTLITSLKVKSKDKGKIAIPAKMFQEIIKSFNNQPLTFKVLQNENNDGGILEILDEKDSYSIALDNANEYPDITDFNPTQKITIASNILVEAISNTLFATSNDTLRPVMGGVLFQFGENETNFVATDSNRLVIYKRTDIKNKESFEFIVPKKPLSIFKNILSTLDEDVTIEFNNVMAKFSFSQHTWICRLIDGKFPNYTAVIPKEMPNILTINRNLLLSSIRRASIFSSKATNQVRFKLSGNILHLHAEDTEFSNKAEMQIPCSYNGDDINIGFSSKFITEMIAILNSDDLIIKISQHNKPGILEPADSLDEHEQIIMVSMPVIGL